MGTQTAQLLDAAAETLRLFDSELDYPILADAIAPEARLALALSTEITELDERMALLVKDRDSRGIVTSAPGVGPITGAVILGRLGDPHRFTSLAGARSFTGLVPSLNSFGLVGQHGGPTKRGDALLREALFMAANSARRQDPTLVAKFHRLTVHAGKHRTSAHCRIAATLLTRTVACWRAGQPYQLRGPDGIFITREQARVIVAERYTVPADIRAARRRRQTGTGRRNEESHRAPHRPTRPSPRLGPPPPLDIA